MKRFTILAAVAALVLGACTKTESFITPNEADAVSFGAYSGRVQTKAGVTDDMNNDALRKADAGFGVFATYSGLEDFEAATFAGANDNFMFNEKITWDGSAWSYSPVKYWPNPTNGQSAAAQKISFFAYAPYGNPAAETETGIYKFSTAVAVDDPSDPQSASHLHDFVHYRFSKDKPNVDLMWGYKAKNINNNTDPATITYDINNNLTRPATATDKVGFIFQHLLAKLGGSQEGPVATPNPYDDPNYVANGLVVKANAETIKPTNGFGANDGTKVTISKIVIGSAPETDALSGAPVTDIDGNPISYASSDMTGKLDLYTGVFTLDGTAQNIQFSQTITNKIDDPNTPEDESASTNSELAESLKEPASVTTFAAIPKGVVEKAINVYKDETNPIILVPGTKPVVDVTVTYFVRTYDSKLPGKNYSEVPQTVFGRIKFPEIKKNTKYNIVMILGLNDVKFEAEVENWETGVVGQILNDLNNDGDYDDPGETTDVNDTEIGLPYNL